MSRSRPLFVWLAAAAFATVGAGVQAQVTTGTIPPLDGEAGQGALPNRLVGQVGITEHLGAQVSPDLTFLDEAGRPVRLGTLLNRDRPVVLAFVYHSCPMLCSLVLDGLADAVKAIDLPVGGEYEVLAVSIDPEDTPARADSAKARYVERIGRPEAAAGLHFWTVTPGAERGVERLADEVGFRYAYDTRTGEYGHNAALFVLSPTGTITRYLYGIDYPPRDVRLALVEAGEGTVGSTLDRFLLTCYEYDEHAQGYSLEVLSVLKYLGGGMLALFALVLGPLWVREVRRQRSDVALGDAPPDVAPSR
jgi:protein SCO1/2